MKISSQVYAVVFLLLGIALLILADHTRNGDVAKEMIAAGGGLITGAAVIYQHDSKSDKSAPKEGA
jgi:hypothetical protein